MLFSPYKMSTRVKTYLTKKTQASNEILTLNDLKICQIYFALYSYDKNCLYMVTERAVYQQSIHDNAMSVKS